MRRTPGNVGARCKRPNVRAELSGLLHKTGEAQRRSMRLVHHPFPPVFFATFPRMKILPTDSIPTDLWKSNIVKLPDVLVESYRAKLQELGLINRSSMIRHDAIHGGKTDDETLEHFALRFATSAGRVEYATLGATSSFEDISDALLSTFSTGPIALLDVPSGTGAASAALIATLIRLRSSSVLPRLPLTIRICAGDFAPKALELFAAILTDLEPHAAKEGINIYWATADWDATRADSTAELVDTWFRDTAGAVEHVVLITNFSGALHNQGAFEAFTPSFEHILARLHNKKGTLIWIEPATKSAKRGLFARVLGLLTIRVPWFSSGTSAAGANAVREADYSVEHPVNGSAFRSNIAILKFDRV